ncbi:MAG TPA: hypothetical protein PLH06_12745, partial [Candidatus Hydrogenedentes bacterium]|nr:hypothetical protein [Candidatus Hydrogenedentota bacterium]
PGTPARAIIFSDLEAIYPEASPFRSTPYFMLFSTGFLNAPRKKMRDRAGADRPGPLGGGVCL